VSKEPIIILLPERFEGREFQVAFDKQIKDIGNAFMIDMEQVEVKSPKSGASEMLSYFKGVQIKPRAIPKRDWGDHE